MRLNRVARGDYLQSRKYITARMPNVFHVRLIASLPKRIERILKLNHLTPKEASKFITVSDRGRGRYAGTYFHARPNDDLLYHLIINTDRIPCPDAAQ